MTADMRLGWLCRGNAIEELEGLRALEGLPRLARLSVQGNGAMDGEDAVGVVSWVRQLQQVDKEQVCEEDRIEAAQLRNDREEQSRLDKVKSIAIGAGECNDDINVVLMRMCMRM